MKTELVPVADLEHHPRNPRIGNVDAIVESIRVNGWYGALEAQKSTRHVLVGNHRLKAARQLGMEKVPVEWLDVDDDTAVRIMLADNRTSDLGVYDTDLLADLLGQFDNADALAGSGWAPNDVAEFGIELPSLPGLDGGDPSAGYSDEYYTPAWIFEELGLTFDLDVASPPHKTNVPAKNRYTKDDDALSQPWDGMVWMNPPFSRASAFLPTMGRARQRRRLRAGSEVGVGRRVVAHR